MVKEKPQSFETNNQPRHMKMGKLKRLYHQRYRTEWEKFPSFEHWLCQSDDGYSAHCNICDVNILTRLASIKQHHNTRKHQEALKCNEFMTKHMVNPEIRSSTQEAKPKRQRVIKKEFDICSNDSMLEDLLGTDDIDREFMDEPQNSRQVNTDVKIEELRMDELQEDVMEENNVINEFDLFGKSLAYQLNHMELEDALLCQERLQVVLTEFRLKLLKRKKEQKRIV